MYTVPCNQEKRTNFTPVLCKQGLAMQQNLLPEQPDTLVKRYPDNKQPQPKSDIVAV